MYRNVFLHQDLTRKNLLLTWIHADSVKTMETFVEKQFSHDPSMHSKFLPTSRHSRLILKFWKNGLFICSIDRVLIADLRNI